MSAASKILAGLNEALAFARGENIARVHRKPFNQDAQGAETDPPKHPPRFMRPERTGK